MKKFLVFIVVAQLACKAAVQTTATKSSPTPSAMKNVVVAQDSTKTPPKPPEPPKKTSKIKDYKDVITKEAVSSKGLFNLHKVGTESYFEIPKSLLDKEMLVTTRISGFVKNLNFGGAGVESRPQRVVRWQKIDDKILLRYISYNSVASEEDPIYQSVVMNNIQPIVMTFDIAALGKDSASYVIEVSPLFTTDIELIGAMSPDEVKRFGVRGVDSKRSYVSKLKAFPQNLEIGHVLTYNGTSLPDNQIAGSMTVELNQSFILLPSIPMTPRHFDARVGYFSVGRTNYSSNEQRTASERFITKWRLEPKPEDKEKYFAGELVEPAKPIVYYIDPATPTKWRKYLKQGIEDWQVAFEQAGFKKAIVAKDSPSKEEDPDWSPEDIRYSVIRYVATDIQNAMRPHVHDPRTGEIIESDIIWYHNVQNLLRNWFFIQTAAINPKARKVNFDDETMGRLIRFVSAHEVGHTLGLPHNMGASNAYPVDSLRSPSFSKKMGVAPSIMDYARFNYVAQPQDGEVGLMPDVGPYDKWSIQFGYKLLPNVKHPDEERTTLNNWIKEKAGDKIYRFGRQRGLPTDPTAQTEDIGDDAMKASTLGIENLKRIVPNLITWSSEDAKDFEQLRELYSQVAGQFMRYMGHVIANVGGVKEDYRSSDQKQAVYSFTEKAKQKEAIAFLSKQLFETPTWMIDKEIITRIEESNMAERIRAMQDQVLAMLMNQDRLKRLAEQSALSGASAYSISEMFDDLSSNIYSEIKTNKIVDIYRRNLQRTFIEGLQRVLEVETNSYEHSDMKAVALGKLKELRSMTSRYSNADKMSKYHKDDIISRIDKLLDDKK
jgi:hypothetical protein